MRVRLFGCVGLVLGALTAVSAADAPRAQPVAPSPVQEASAQGYLDGALLSQALELMPRPPAAGSAEAKADAAVFVRTRALRNGPRWRLAQRDVTDSPFDTFACALGLQLKPGDDPALDRLLQRMGADRRPLVDAAKFHYRALRPYQKVDGPICEAKTEHLAGNPDYPSGHAASGWSIALVLAELAPDRAAPILKRGRAFAQSRLICGSHNKSAVDAATLLASELVAAEHGSAAFRADIDAARTGLTGKGSPPDKDRCRLETVALRDQTTRGS
jgi:acid phosphatase (class A)